MFLGNLTIKEFEQRTGWDLTDEERKWLEAHRQNNATVRMDSGKFHIFDLPFCIHTSPLIKDELMAIAEKRRYISREFVQMVVVEETEEEKAEKRRETERLEWESKKADPNKRWMWKWGLRIPLNGCEYHAFFNTECLGYENHGEPKGTFWIKRDAEGLHGGFELDNPEINASSHPEWNYVIGLGTFKDGYRTNDMEFEFNGRIEDCLAMDFTHAMEV